uniref:MFS domain-containing protein n=1 Tax=Globodera pallida TaxID=36090 RepID=A0A183BPZ1_GLOPA
MCDLRSTFLKPLDLETIEEEEADFLSQHSRNNLRNGNRRSGGAQSRPLSQANTITTYDTQHDLLLDVNSLAYLNVNSGRANGSRRNSMHQSTGSAFVGDRGSTVTNKTKSLDKWDSNYYYNDYDPSDPIDIYLSNKTPPTTTSARRDRRRGTPTTPTRMTNWLGWLWCGSSVRFFILLLSFLSLASLFANIQLFNLVALYAEKDLLPPFLQHQSVVSKTVWSPPDASRWSNNFGGKGNGSVLDKPGEEERLLTVVRLSEEAAAANGVEAVDKVWAASNGTETLANVEKGKGQQHTPSPGKHQKGGFGDGLSTRLLQSFSFSVPGIGILLGHFPCVFLIRRISAHKMIFTALIISGAVTAAFPFIINSGVLFVILSRALLGLAFSPAFVFVGVNAANWATLGEQLLFILAGFMAVQFGPTLSWVSSVFILSVDSHNSRMRLFGLHSAVSTLLAILWLIFYRDHPQKYALVNGEEIARITRGKSIRRTARPRLPRSLGCLLVRSASAWACWVSSFCYFFVVLSLHIFLPVFTYKMLQRFIDTTIVASFAFLLISHLFVHLISGFFGPSSSWKVRTFNSIGFLSSSILFLTMTIIPRDHLYENRCALLLRLCLIPLGACSAGAIKSAAVCGRLFTQHIVAHMQIAFGLAYFMVPTMVFMIGAESPIVNWRLLFLCCALVLLVGLAFFVIFGSGVPTGWANQWAEEAKERDSLLMVKFTKTPFE